MRRYNGTTYINVVMELSLPENITYLTQTRRFGGQIIPVL